MKQKMKGVLIDPEKSSIDEVEFEVEGEIALWKMRELIGAQCLDVARHNLDWLPSSPDDDIWVDDEGLLRSPEHFFLIPGHGWYAGRGLILGYDENNGDTTSHNLTPDDILELKLNVMYGHGKLEDYTPSFTFIPL